MCEREADPDGLEAATRALYEQVRVNRVPWEELSPLLQEDVRDWATATIEAYDRARTQSGEATLRPIELPTGDYAVPNDVVRISVQVDEKEPSEWRFNVVVLMNDGAKLSTPYASMEGALQIRDQTRKAVQAHIDPAAAL